MFDNSISFGYLVAEVCGRITNISDPRNDIPWPEYKWSPEVETLRKTIAGLLVYKHRGCASTQLLTAVAGLISQPTCKFWHLLRLGHYIGQIMYIVDHKSLCTLCHSNDLKLFARSPAFIRWEAYVAPVDIERAAAHQTDSEIAGSLVVIMETAYSKFLHTPE